MNLVRSALVDNPMLSEIPRKLGRMLGRGNAAAVNRLGVLCAICGYLAFFVLVVQASMPYEGVLYVELALMAILIAPLTHKAIAGERDRRSWDLLLAAPLSPEQIVVARFVTAAIPMLLIIVLGLLLAPFAGHNDWRDDTFRSPSAAVVFVSQLYVFTWSLCATATGILISARSKRAFTALAAIFGVLILWLVVLQSLLVTTIAFVLDLASALFPFLHVTKLLSTGWQWDTNDPGGYTEWLYATLIASLLFAVLTIVLLEWASKTLHFADNQIRFLGNKHNA